MTQRVNYIKNIIRQSFKLRSVLSFLPLLSLLVALAGNALCADTEDIYEQGIHLVRPDSDYIYDNYSFSEYLSVEDLVFVSCLEEEDVPLQPSVMCIDNNNFEDLEAIKWTKENNCYISYMNLEGFDCDNIRLQAEYSIEGETFRLYKELNVNELSKVLDKIIDTQYSDGGWKTTIDTAYGIWALSRFGDIFHSEIDRALDWLKLERNDELKCWPKAPCHLPLTIEILYLLTLSGFDDAKRAVHDARNWIETMQKFYEQGDKWSVEIEVFREDTNFMLAAVDDEILDEDFEMDNKTKKTLYFNAYKNSTLYLISHDNFKAEIKDKNGELVYRYQGSNLSYTIDGACWSANAKGEPCNTETTAYAVNLNLESRNIREAKRWMFSKINYSDVVGLFYGDINDTIETSLFISSMHNMSSSGYLNDYSPYISRYDYMSEPNRYDAYISDAVDWLLFKQNNEGSWGQLNESVAYKAKYTAYSVLALKDYGYNRTYEPIEDAEAWLSKNEFNISRNDTASLSSAFYVLRNNARPLLASNPGIITIKEKVTQIELINPTTFDLDNLEYYIPYGL